MRTALPLLSIGLMLAATVTPTTALLPQENEEACQVETLDSDVIVLCLGDSVVEISESAGSTPNPLAGGFCATYGRVRYDYGPGEEKWTPLYGTNSPLQGTATVAAQTGQSVEMSIGFTFDGTGVRLRAAETLSDGVSVTAEYGESIVVYQNIEWAHFDKYRCNDFHFWSYEGDGYGPKNYTPDGVIRQKPGSLHAGDPAADWDNNMLPSESWSTADNTIAINLRYISGEMDLCLKNQKIWFGEEKVYSVGVEMSFGGGTLTGATKASTEANSFVYDFEDGCYWIDPLGNKKSKTGLAFYMYEEDATTGGETECNTKGVLEDALEACVNEPCTDKLPSEDTVQEVICEALPSCQDIEEAAPFICAMPKECEAGEEGTGEPCVPGVPGKPSCPPPSVALPVESCGPCDALKTPIVECGIPHPTCEDAGLDCPIGTKPCGEYAPGIEGAIAKWVCEDGDDPCALAVIATLEELLACGGPPE